MLGSRLLAHMAAMVCFVSSSDQNLYSNLKNRLFMDSVSSNHPNFDAIMYPHGTQFRLVVFSVAKRHLSGFKTQWVDD